jgi:hypothetical protein
MYKLVSVKMLRMVDCHGTRRSLNQNFKILGLNVLR